MKLTRVISILSFAIVFPATLFARGEKYLVSGSGWDKIAIIDRDTKAPVWMTTIPDGGECNSVVYTKHGAVAFTYSRGARKVDMTNMVLWDYKVQAPREVQSIVEHKGKFILGVCGNPASIVVLDRFGDERKVINFDAGTTNPHGQFRQIRVSEEGNYLVPLLSGKVLVLSPEGELLKTHQVGGVLFSLTQLPDGNWLLPQGDSHSYVEYDPVAEKIVRKFTSDDIEGVKLGFVAQLIRYNDGRTLICNWLRHGGDKTQPMLLEVDSQGKVLWSVDKNDKGIGDISTVCPLKGKFSK